MAEQIIDKEKKPSKQPMTNGTTFMFSRENYLILGGGLVLIAIGFLLMAGGAQPPDKFDESEVYSFRRTTLSTIFVMSGFVVALFSIFRKQKA